MQWDGSWIPLRTAKPPRRLQLEYNTTAMPSQSGTQITVYDMPGSSLRLEPGLETLRHEKHSATRLSSTLTSPSSATYAASEWRRQQNLL